MLKTLAYVMSMLGVIALSGASFLQAEPHSATRVVLAGGVVFSLAGLVIRLVWHHREHVKKAPRKAPRAVAAPGGTELRAG